MVLVSGKPAGSPARVLCWPRRALQYQPPVAMAASGGSLCAFVPTSCLPGLEMPPRLAARVCTRPNASALAPYGGLPTLCSQQEACAPGSTPCLIFANGTLRGDPLLSDGMRAGHAKRAEEWHAIRRSHLLGALEGRTVSLLGDSLMREIFLRTIALLRGQIAVADAAFHSDAVYIVGYGPSAGSPLRDALVPMLPSVPASCALRLLHSSTAQGKCSLEFQQQRLTITNKGRGSEATLREIVELQSDVLRPGVWDLNRSTIVTFTFVTDYSTRTFAGLPTLHPDFLITGTFGAHVPCWSDGQVGHKCSIERVTPANLSAFEEAATRQMQNAQPRLRALAWLTFPHGHAGARWINGNYSAWNIATTEQIKRVGQNLNIPTRIIPFAELVRLGSEGGVPSGRPLAYLFDAGTLAMRGDTTHFQCNVKGRDFYPSYRFSSPRDKYEVRLSKIDWEATRKGIPVTCLGNGENDKDCIPKRYDGCADFVNGAVALMLARFLLFQGGQLN